MLAIYSRSHAVADKCRWSDRPFASLPMATQIVLGTGTNKVQAHEKQYFLETPDSLVLQGLDSTGEQSKTYGQLNKAATCRKCLEAGRYKYTSVRHKKVIRDTSQPFVTLERELQNTILDKLKKRLSHLLNSVEVQLCVLPIEEHIQGVYGFTVAA